ncbi:MAG: hypothetical protein R3Y43_03325 [Alphaproteobacteria bacterium]
MAQDKKTTAREVLETFYRKSIFSLWDFDIPLELETEIVSLAISDFKLKDLDASYQDRILFLHKKLEKTSKYVYLATLYKSAEKNSFKNSIMKNLKQVQPYKGELEDILEALKDINLPQSFHRNILKRIKLLNSFSLVKNDFAVEILDYFDNLSIEDMSKMASFLEIWHYLIRNFSGYNAKSVWDRLTTYTQGMNLKEKKKFDEDFLAVAKKLIVTKEFDDEMLKKAQLSYPLEIKIKNLISKQ